MGERVGLAYDATDAYLRAAANLGGVPLSRGAIWELLDTLTPFDGIAGLVDLKAGVQDDHWIAIMAVDQVGNADEVPRIVYHCGRVDSRGSAACSSDPI